MSEGYVYFVGSLSDLNQVKIGFTRRHPNQRICEFQPGSPLELDVYFYVEGSYWLERTLHATFASVRLHNEWFHTTGCLETLVNRLLHEGKGAKAPTDWQVFKLALFECVYDVVPDRVPPESDWRMFDATADTEPLNPLFTPEYCRDHWVVRV